MSLHRWGVFALLIVVAIGVYGVHTLQSAKLYRLFDGPIEICQPEAADFYHQINYNLSEYTGASDSSESQRNDAFATRSAQGDMPWVDGESRDEVEAVMRQHAQDSASKSNPALDRLQSPTVYKDPKPARSLQISTPTDGAVYPPNLCAPFVEWEDPRNTLWQISLQIPGMEKPSTFISKSQRWRFPENVWQELCNTAQGDTVILQVRGILRDDDGQRAGNVQSTPEIHFSISSDAADDYIVYRLVDPPFSSYKTPNILIRDIRKDEPEFFVSARRQYCLNCHTFSSKEGNKGKLAMQVRSLVSTMHNLSVYVAIYDMDKECGYKVKLPFEIQMTTFMSWSPDQNQLAYSANQKVAAIKPITFETQLAGMATSDIAIYDLENNNTWLVPGASDPNFLEIYPCWTPDGKTLLFSRSPVGEHPAHILFDLYAVNLEGEPSPRPIEDAGANGLSNYYPRFSPDGKWFSYCRCDGGDLIRSSSDLFLKAGDLSGPSHKLDCNVDYAADSWHSWSSNSRWLVFASKRGGGIYAYLYMTHIDDNGHASPAIPLPMVERPFASYNIPEFVKNRPPVKESDLFDPMRTETQPHLAQLKVLAQGNNHVQKEIGED